MSNWLLYTGIGAAYALLASSVVAFLIGAHKREREEEERLSQPVVPLWWKLHTEEELDLMTRWGDSVHTEDEHCQVRCVVHNPSEGKHREYPVNWRTDLQTLERICDHGVGHPDPDQFYWLSRTGTLDKVLHSCDGCCVRWMREVRNV